MPALRGIDPTFSSPLRNELPDDDAGQADIWLLVQNVSTAVSNAERKMRHAIELWAPWMPADKAEAMMAFAMRLPRFERCPTSPDLGESLRITNAPACSQALAVQADGLERR